MHYLNYKVFKRRLADPIRATGWNSSTNIITGAHHGLKRSYDMVIVDSYRYTFEKKQNDIVCIVPSTQR